MSTSKETTIWCDVKDCPEWVQICERSDDDARAEAKRRGWRYRSKRDLCPAHAQGHEPTNRRRKR